MGIARATGGDNAANTLAGHLHEHGGRNVIAEQDAFIRKDNVTAALALQLCQHPPPQVAHVRCPLPQVGVVHHLEVTHVDIHHRAQGPLGPLAFTNLRNHFRRQGVAVQHAQVDIEQGLLFGAQGFGSPLGQVADFLTDPHQRIIQPGNLGTNVVHTAIRHGGQVRLREQQHAIANRRARAAGQAIIETGQVHPAGVELIEQHAGRMGMGNYGGKLGGNGNQECLFALVEAAHITLLDDHDSQHLAVMHHRHAKKGMERIFAGFRQVMEFGVGKGVFQVDRFLAQAHLPHQPPRTAPG